MTVSVPTNLLFSYSGDGSTTVFSYPVRFLGDDDLVVVLEDASSVQTVQERATDYTVLGAGEGGGGSITMLTAPAVGETLYLYRDTAASQTVDLTDNNRSPAATVEKQLDRFAMALQDQASISAWAFRAPVGESGGQIDTIAEGHFWKADSAGNLVDGGSADDIAAAQSNAEIATAKAAIATTKAQEASDSAAEAAATVASLGKPLSLKVPDPSWDASAGTFPGDASVTAGTIFIVSVAGTVDGVAFSASPADMLIALVDSPSTATYAGNWLKQDFSDAVLSVAGLTGAISSGALATALGALLMPKSGGTFGGGVSFGSNTGASADDLSKHIALNGTQFGINVTSPQTVNYVSFATHAFRVNGVQALKINGSGVTVGTPTGGDPGAGKVNAVDYQINGVSVATSLAAKATLADLASTATGKGAALVGVEDAAGNFAGSTVEAALAELAAATGGGIGVGQARQNVAASRLTNTAYQNTTGKPIEVSISATGTGSGTRGFYTSPDGVTYTRIGKWTDSGNPTTITVIVPAGHYYKTDTGPTIDCWTELR
jgi:hypothetical protein